MNKFTCEACGEQFDNDPSDEQPANVEAEIMWGVKNASHDPKMSRVCTACYRKILKWLAKDVASRFGTVQ